MPDWLIPAVGNTEAQFVTLAAIDDALGDCHPQLGAGHYGNLVQIAARWPLTGTLTSGGAITGGLIFRWARPGRPGYSTERVQDAFHSVVRIQEWAWARLDRVVIDRRFDLPSHAKSMAKLRFSFSPVLMQIEDLVIETGRGLPGLPDANWYRVRPNTEVIKARIPDILAAMDAANCQVGLLPEAAINPELLNDWQVCLRNTPRPATSSLRWLMVGSGPFPVEHREVEPTNSAFLLHRDTGSILLRHDKFAPFNFDVGQPERWGLAGQLSADPPIHEAIYQGQRGSMLESHIGRVAILICEDVTRHGEPVADALTIAGPSLLLVPVLARITKRYFWEEYAAQRHVGLVGATVAIANSLAIPDAEMRFGSPDDDSSPAFCLLALAAEDESPELGALDGASLCVALPGTP